MKNFLLALVALFIFCGCTNSAQITSNKSKSGYLWPEYSPNLDSNFKDFYQDIKPPTKVLDDVTGVMGTVTSGWWCFRYGSNLNAKVTEAAWKPMLARMNKDFKYMREVMGVPPDKRAKNGYFSTVYLFGSGLSTDNADIDALGGWQGNTHYKGENWPMVLLSYYPIASFDPACTNSDIAYQCGASVHEGVHAVLADMPGCRKAGWFHEGGNNAIQALMESQKSGNYDSIGWLGSGAMIAPFMPIECYSGWLQDGSFGGPSAEGVNRYTNRVQLCTWRNLLGGTQYGETFPIFLGECLSPGSLSWIWQNCTNRVLEGLANGKGGLGDAQTRHLIKEFRARQAMCDFGKWSSAYVGLLDDARAWGNLIKAESSPFWIDCQVWTATCYQATSLGADKLTLTPEFRTLPGWSGANQIPLKIDPKASNISIDFLPAEANMSCQLVYRAEDGAVVYSQPVDKGSCTLDIIGKVKNNVVIAVVCSTDYLFKGDQTRKKKYAYKLKLGKGIQGPADIYTKWYK